MTSSQARAADGASPAEEPLHFFHGLLQPAEPLQGRQREPHPGLTPPVPVPPSIEALPWPVRSVRSVLFHSWLSPKSSVSSALSASMSSRSCGLRAWLLSATRSGNDTTQAKVLSKGTFSARS